MGKNKNNSSTKISNKVAEVGKEQNAASKAVNNCRRETRSSLKRSNGDLGCEEQPLLKQKKSGKATTRVKTHKSDVNEPNKGTKPKVKAHKAIPDKVVVKATTPVVNSARSLIASIKNGTLGRAKQAEKMKPCEERVKPKLIETTKSPRVTKSTKLDPRVKTPKPHTSREEEPISSDDDGVALMMSSDDDYMSESGEDSSSSDDNLTSSSDDEQSFAGNDNDREIVQGEAEDGQYQSSSEEEGELDREDPRVKRLLEKIKEEERQAKKGNMDPRSGEGKLQQVSKPGKTNKLPSKRLKVGIADKIKSPSDTTIYAPALLKDTIGASPVGAISTRHLRIPNVDMSNVDDHVSQFVERVRRDSRRSGDRSESRERSRSQERQRHGSGERGSKRGEDDRSQSRNRSRSVADNIVLQAERFKATIDPPKGNESLEENVKQLISLLQSKGSLSEPDTDDDFFHITCHIEQGLKTKIANGEFVDLEKLLPKSRSQMMTGYDNEIEVIRKNGSTYVIPETGQKDIKINSIRRWEQAFRVYCAIYCEANPDRAAEIWQYVHVINTAAQSYTWENVSFYDVTFRQLMHKKPHRSWAKIYTQMWNLSLTDKINRTGYAGYQGSSHNNSHNAGFQQKHGDWRDKCCWRFNKGKCRRWTCKFEHRCSTKDCGSYSHPAYQCPKKKKGSPGNSNPQTGGGGNQNNSRQSESKIL